MVIRTNFFGWGPAYKASFSDKILKNLEAGKQNNLFDDVYYTPISVKTLSEKITLLIKKGEKVYSTFVLMNVLQSINLV